jgi:hypothetical protein
MFIFKFLTSIVLAILTQLLLSIITQHILLFMWHLVWNISLKCYSTSSFLI